MNIKQRQYVIKRISEQSGLINEIEVENVNFPNELKLLHAVIEKNLSRFDALPKEQSLLLMLDIASTMGGHQLYLPQAEALLLVLRDVLIKYDFDGKNADELSMRYGLSTASIYQNLKATPRLKFAKLNLASRTHGFLPKQNKWPPRVIELFGVIEEALTSVGLNGEGNTTKIAMHIMQKYGGRQVYFPRGDAIKRHIVNNEIYDLRCQGVPVRQIALKYGLSTKQAYEICAQFKKKNEPLGINNE